MVNRSTILYSHEAHVTVYCPFRFEQYPLDVQICPVHIGSYAFDEKNMKFRNQVLNYDDVINQRKIIHDYDIKVTPLNEEERTYVWLDIGNFSLTGFKVQLTRNYMKYVFNYFLPSGLFVVVSWSSFLIPPENVPGRMTLLVTLFLVLINIFNNITTQSPNTETMTSISAWMLSCIFFVFGALAVYAVILFLIYMKGKAKIVSASSPPIGNLMQVALQSHELKGLDMICLFIFPTLFLLFNLIFWPIYVQ